MELLVLPNIEDGYKRERAIDELPQSAGGRTIMTTEPKFIPNEAIEVSLNENVKLKMQINDLSAKKNQIDLKKLQTKADELIKRYSKGKTYLNDIEKKLIQKPPLKELNKIITENPNGDNKMQGIINEYESQIEEILESKSQLQSKLNASEKEKEDLQTKFREEFMLMSSVIYNLGFLYWSMKSEYEDKLKSNKGWLETERIKQYNGDY